MLVTCIGYKFLIGSFGNVCQLSGTSERKFHPISDFSRGMQGLCLHFMGFILKRSGVQMLGTKTDRCLQVSLSPSFPTLGPYP